MNWAYLKSAAKLEGIAKKLAKTSVEGEATVPKSEPFSCLLHEPDARSFCFMTSECKSLSLRMEAPTVENILAAQSSKLLLNLLFQLKPVWMENEKQNL